ncbi:peptidase inhibitor family I36 protein [Parafrankia sp. EUN1f]|uniref:peptidase inhibitor family I36 protein n=1 Tax=Parafrankia sp. EUN1f TaxID=102897 RepID=UPI0012F8D32A|nr:peptidase inhibitor family I36 protein [Parafrankia sp. EUN1f]
MNRSRISLGALVLSGAVAVLAGAGPASASTGSTSPAHKGGTTQSVVAPRPNGICQTFSDGTGELCMWYFVNSTGSMLDLWDQDSNLNDNVFLTDDVGKGQTVGNNFESTRNTDSIYSAVLCDNPGFTGPTTTIAPNSGTGDLGTLRNRVESEYWIS